MSTASLSKGTFFVIIAMFIIIEMAAAADYKVGSPGGWDLQTDLSTWASKITFRIGDNLVFVYDKTKHDVVEVSKPKYDSCNTTGLIKTQNSGDDIIPLSSPVSRYFICGFPAHCVNGMKVQIDTTAAPEISPPPLTGAPAGPTPPSAAGRMAADGTVATAGLVVLGVMMMMMLAI